MEFKKSPTANLERRRPLLFLAGAIIALSFSLVAFEWKTPYDKQVTTLGGDIIEVYEIEEIPLVQIEDDLKEEEKVEKKKTTNDIKPVDEIDIPDEGEIEEEPVEKVDVEDLAGKMLVTNAKIEEVIEEPEPVIRFADKMPVFKCMNDEAAAQIELLNYIQKRIIYPRQAVELGITGRVTVEFVVDKKGNIRDVKILEGLGYGCDEEVIRVVESLPDFCPGYLDGKYRDIFYTLPVRFQMR